MSGMADGVSTVWTIRKSGNFLDIEGYKSDVDAVVAITRQDSYKEGWLDRAVAMRNAVQREIRNERARIRREGGK